MFRSLESPDDIMPSARSRRLPGIESDIINAPPLPPRQFPLSDFPTRLVCTLEILDASVSERELNVRLTVTSPETNREPLHYLLSQLDAEWSGLIQIIPSSTTSSDETSQFSADTASILLEEPIDLSQAAAQSFEKQQQSLRYRKPARLSLNRILPPITESSRWKEIGPDRSVNVYHWNLFDFYPDFVRKSRKDVEEMNPMRVGLRCEYVDALVGEHQWEVLERCRRLTDDRGPGLGHGTAAGREEEVLKACERVGIECHGTVLVMGL